MTDSDTPRCPHCKQKMKKWRVPDASSWHNAFFYVCFNDQCPYFVNGWQHIWDTQQTRASYRCRFDPDTQSFMPLPVWSNEALKENIID